MKDNSIVGDVFKTFLKTSTDELLRIERGKEFLNLGAHTANDRSPQVRIFEGGSTRSPLQTGRKEYELRR